MIIRLYCWCIYSRNNRFKNRRRIASNAIVGYAAVRPHSSSCGHRTIGAVMQSRFIRPHRGRSGCVSVVTMIRLLRSRCLRQICPIRFYEPYFLFYPRRDGWLSVSTGIIIRLYGNHYPSLRESLSVSMGIIIRLYGDHYSSLWGSLSVSMGIIIRLYGDHYPSLWGSLSVSMGIIIRLYGNHYPSLSRLHHTQMAGAHPV